VAATTPARQTGRVRARRCRPVSAIRVRGLVHRRDVLGALLSPNRPLGFKSLCRCHFGFWV
jgi:hypothetical protein